MSTIKFIKNQDCFEVEGWGRYPILGDDTRFVWGKYERNDDSMSQYLINHNFHPDDSYKSKILIIWTSLHRLCNDCYECNEDKRRCYKYNQYYFTEFFCDKTKEKFFLVTTSVDACSVEESDWFFIPGHVENINIFNKVYLDNKYVYCD